MQRRDFLKLTAAASFTAAAAACNAASAASSGPASEALPGSTPAASETKASEGEATLTTNEGDTISLASLEHCTQEETAPTVYFTREISAEALVQAYQALGWAPAGKVAVKLSTGEPPASNYLRPDLVAGLVQLVNGTIVECNTAYGGSRSSTESHRQVAEEHGFCRHRPGGYSGRRGFHDPAGGRRGPAPGKLCGSILWGVPGLCGAVPLQGAFHGRLWGRHQEYLHRAGQPGDLI